MLVPWETLLLGGEPIKICLDRKQNRKAELTKNQFPRICKFRGYFFLSLFFLFLLHFSLTFFLRVHYLHYKFSRFENLLKSYYRTRRSLCTFAKLMVPYVSKLCLSQWKNIITVQILSL